MELLFRINDSARSFRKAPPAYSHRAARWLCLPAKTHSRPDRMAAGSAPTPSGIGVELGREQPGTLCCCSCSSGCCCCGSPTGSSCRCCSNCRRESRGSSLLATTPKRCKICRRNAPLSAGITKASSACIRCCKISSLHWPHRCAAS